MLGEPDVTLARDRLAQALLERTTTVNAARVHLSSTGDVAWFRTGPAPDIPADRLPSAEEIRAHPVFLYHCRTGRDEPVLLTRVLAEGTGITARTLAIIRELGITIHQCSVPVEPCGPDGGYDGWMLVGEEAIGESVIPELTRAQPLLRGLDRHLRLLGDLVPVRRGGPVLTPRESVVLAMLATGSTAEGIAARLLISPRTVHKHQEHLYRKLGAVDRLSAVLRGQELGILAPPPRPSSWPVADHPAEHSARYAIRDSVRTMKSSSPR